MIGHFLPSYFKLYASMRNPPKSGKEVALENERIPSLREVPVMHKLITTNSCRLLCSWSPLSSAGVSYSRVVVRDRNF